ncbi:MAG: hypothetical protein QOE24_2224 [Frankiales bacterium]|jgi:hypothetical protein|nr:hypothetical protein [Frankiales bacterium]MDX6221466.1 hypothetical protein [Frankiales bacterium]
MNTGRRVRRETGWRSMACAVCGPDTTHAMIRSGLPRFRWFGPPAGQVREYARCLACGTQRSLEESLSWTDAVRVTDDLPIGADPR